MAEPIVEVQQGKLKGKTGVDYKGGNYYSFQGIPYAKPPVGELRFKAPVPAEPWEGVRDATVEGSESVSRHMVFFNAIGTEDCLNLNVYTPQLPSAGTPLKPVMVWIHGGAFTQGSNKTEIYGPEFLVTEDVVLVIINYRLGILGFLSLEDPSLGVPGNAGLKDMVMALQWVQQNIAKFNGDPKNVTIFGESAGGAAVHYMVLSPMAKGLFHRAILQSGCTLCPWAYGTRNAPEVAKILGYESNNEKDCLEFLKTVPAEKFVEALDGLNDPIQVDTIRPVGPVIEKPSNEAFISEHPIDIIQSGNYNKVPMMIGYTTREGMLIEIIHKKAFGEIKLPSNFENSIPAYYKVPKDSDLSKTIAKSIKDFYYGDCTPSLENIDKFYILTTDIFFWRGLYIAMKNHLPTTSEPIYLYRFAVESNLNMYKKIGNITAPGVAHADDLGYIFKTMITPEFDVDSLEGKSVHRVVKLWANFARSGNPNPTEKDPLIDVTWQPIKSDQFNFLDIGENLTTGTNPDFDRMEFWDKISSMSAVNSKL